MGRNDIVLIANDECELQRILNLATNFASNCKLSLNHSKFNELTVGNLLKGSQLGVILYCALEIRENFV